MRSNTWLFIFGLIALMVHVQFNLHEMIWFVLGSFVAGFFPLEKMNFFKYALLEILVLVICLLLQLPSKVVMTTAGEILKTGGAAYLAIIFAISTITFALCAQLVYVFITKPYILKTT